MLAVWSSGSPSDEPGSRCAGSCRVDAAFGASDAGFGAPTRIAGELEGINAPTTYVTPVGVVNDRRGAIAVWGRREAYGLYNFDRRLEAAARSGDRPFGAPRQLPQTGNQKTLASVRPSPQGAQIIGRSGVDGQWDRGPFRIESVSVTFEGAVGRPKRLSAPRTDVADLGLDVATSAGPPLAVWVEWLAIPPDLLFTQTRSRTAAATDFSRPGEPVTAPGKASLRAPVAATNARGRRAAAWVRTAGNKSTVQVARLQPPEQRRPRQGD